jgi:hypothetical protein
VKQFGSKLQALVLELRRRRVIRAAGVYLVAGWVVVEVTATVFPLLGFADWATRLVLAVTAAGFPVALWLAWVLEIAPGGVRVEVSQTEIAEKHLRISQAVFIAVATVVGLAVPAFIILQSRDRPADAPATEKRSSRDWPAPPAFEYSVHLSLSVMKPQRGSTARLASGLGPDSCWTGVCSGPAVGCVWQRS